MSEKVERRNRTRRLYRSLFADSDAIDALPVSDSPTAFVKLAEFVRKRTLLKMRAKVINDFPLSGSVLASLFS